MPTLVAGIRLRMDGTVVDPYAHSMELVLSPVIVQRVAEAILRTARMEPEDDYAPDANVRALRALRGEPRIGGE